MTARARIALVLAIAGLALVMSPGEASANRAVVVKAQDIAPYSLAVDGFRRSFGGDVLVIELNDEDVSAAQVRQIRGHQPVAIIAIGSKAATSLKERIDDIPIVYCMVMGAGDRGLVGPNIAGISLEIPPSEQLNQFRRVVSGLDRVGIIHNPSRGANPVVEGARLAARAQGVTLVEREVTRPGDVPEAINDLVGNVNGLWLLADASLVTNETFRHILVTSLERRIPLFVFSAPFVRAGALVGVAPNYSRIGEEAAAIVREVMGGRQAGSIPTRDPPAAVVINAATAARMGIELSAEVRASATILQ